MMNDLDILYHNIQNEKERCQMEGTGNEFDLGYFEALNEVLDMITKMQKEVKLPQ